MIAIESEMRPFARRALTREAQEMAKYAKYELGAEPEFLLPRPSHRRERARENLFIMMTRLFTPPLR
jgi:hypothetical protein